MNLTRYHGVFARGGLPPNSKHRALVTPERRGKGKLDKFRWVKAPTTQELLQLTHTLAHRIGQSLERQGLLLRDAEQSYLALDSSDEYPEDSMNQLQGHSITYRIAVGPRQGYKVFTLQTLPGTEAARQNWTHGTGLSVLALLNTPTLYFLSSGEAKETTAVAFCRYILTTTDVMQRTTL